MNTFLYIFEDGNFKLGPEPTEEDKSMVDEEGILDIVDTANRTFYLDGDWNPIEVIEEQ